MAADAYFLTFGTYGAHLHGDSRGSTRASYGRESENEALRGYRRSRLRAAPMTLDERAREVVMQAILEVARYRGWAIRAVHVRTEHVHVVVRCEVSPERAMNDFKAYATRALRRAGIVSVGAVVWARHGSTVHLRGERDVGVVADYVYDRQGVPMARYGANV